MRQERFDEQKQGNRQRATGNRARASVLRPAACCLLAVACCLAVCHAQPVDGNAVDTWVTVKGQAAGTSLKSQDEATAAALRTAVEQACGTFLTSQSKSVDYKTVYDKVFANTVGYVREHKVMNVAKDAEMTTVTVRARVSTQKFREDWASIAHTVNQEGNPRVIIAIAESTRETTTGPAYDTKDNGMVQGKVEDFFLSKNIILMDKDTAGEVTKRDVLLAAIKNDDKEVASLGARFKADVVVTGRVTAKFGKTIEVAGQELYQFTASMSVRVVQSDSARVLVSKAFGPFTCNSLQRSGGEDKALTKLADEAAPELLAAVVEAWRKRANVSRTVTLAVSGMDYNGWKKFKEEADKLRGVQALRLREITESVANIDVEYQYSNENLADNLTELKSVKLSVTEITSNRIKLKAAE